MAQFSYWNQTTNARRNQTALTMDEVKMLAPAVMERNPVETVSTKYKFISTEDVITIFAKEGYVPVRVRSARCAAGETFAKHQVELQHRDNLVLSLGSVASRIILSNGHDGKTGYNMTEGMWRLICENGLVTPVGSLEKVSFPHTGKDIELRIISGIVEISKRLPIAAAMREAMMVVRADREVARIMAKSAIAERWGKNGKPLHLPDGTVIEMPPSNAVDVTESMSDKKEEIVRAPVTIDQMLYTRREEDKTGMLWETYQTIQENVTKGGMRGISVNDQGRRSRNEVRAVTSLDKDFTLNRALWVMANEMRAMLAPAVI